MTHVYLVLEIIPYDSTEIVGIYTSEDEMYKGLSARDDQGDLMVSDDPDIPVNAYKVRLDAQAYVRDNGEEVKIDFKKLEEPRCTCDIKGSGTMHWADCPMYEEKPA